MEQGKYYLKVTPHLAEPSRQAYSIYQNDIPVEFKLDELPRMDPNVIPKGCSVFGRDLHAESAHEVDHNRYQYVFCVQGEFAKYPDVIDIDEYLSNAA